MSNAYLAKSVKHTCVFELERQGNVFTGEVVCTACGVYLSSQPDRPTGKRQGRTGTWESSSRQREPGGI